MRFLITGNPRSGTYYMAEMLRALGHDIGREKIEGIGVVSWRHAASPRRYSVIAHQLRHPLKSIGSPIHHRVFSKYYKILDKPKQSDYLYQRMYCWLGWIKYLEVIRDFHYKIEDFDLEYPIVLGKLGLEIPDKLPELSKELNTRKNHRGNKKLPAYKKLIWRDLEVVDVSLFKKIQKKGREYGYY